MPRKFYRQVMDEGDKSPPSIVFENSQREKYIEITDNDEKKVLYSKRYKTVHKPTGQEYVFDYTAQLYLDILSGTITPMEVYLFEQHAVNLLRQINGGHWQTGQSTNANLALSGIYNQDRKDEIQLDIDNYINDNY
jgi:hypothetical protein